MSGGEVGQAGGAPGAGSIKPESKEQKEKKQLLAAIKTEREKEGTPLWKVVNTSKNVTPFVLSYNTDGLLNDPSKKSLAQQIRKTYILLDKSLSALGYKRDRFREPGVPDEKQIDWSWVNLRMVKFFKDQGLLAKDSQATSVRFGIKGLETLQKALSK